jgi:hypothetical protein
MEQPSVDLTLRLAYQARAVHSPVCGSCEHCRVRWPCAAAQRVEDVLRMLSAHRVLGRCPLPVPNSPCRPRLRG